MSDSKAMRFLQATWDMAHPKKSWRTLNSMMHQALRMAINAGTDFGEADFLEFHARFRFGYWIGADGVEIMYGLAIEAGNRSAWRAIEYYLGRQPFIVKRARYGHLHVMPRVCVGAEFDWEGERVKVTSFDDTNRALIACSYKPHRVAQKILHRYVITHAEIRVAQKRSKAA